MGKVVTFEMGQKGADDGEVEGLQGAGKVSQFGRAEKADKGENVLKSSSKEE